MRAHASPPALRELRQPTFAFCSLLKTLNLNSAASRPSLGATVQRPKLLPASAKNLSRYVARQKKRARKKSCNAHTSRSVTPRTVTHACVQNTAQKAVTQKSPRITPAPGTPWKSTAKCSMTHTNPPPRDTYTRHSCASHPQKRSTKRAGDCPVPQPRYNAYYRQEDTKSHRNAHRTNASQMCLPRIWSLETHVVTREGDLRRTSR